MSHTVRIEGTDHIFTVQDGQTLLDAALAHDILLPYSCRTGSCSSCKGHVVSGQVNTGPGTKTLLSEQEQAEGACLFCETEACSDLVIRPREVLSKSLFEVKKIPVRVSALEKAADDVMILTLQTPASESFLYAAGQYLEFVLKDGQRRAYSLATRPTGESSLELHIRHLPGGLFTDHVFGVNGNGLKVRDILRVEGPFGSFFLREDSDKPIILLGSGTGFAPLKAIMQSLVHANSTRHITLYWGGRRPKDLYQSALCDTWAQQLPHFRFVPVVSDALPEDNWQGRTGFVHQAVLDDIPDLSGYQVYACGAPIVVDSARKAYIAAGLPDTEFFADAFISAADQAS